jgi:pimeloyl-ACP methyl ester carboxylesterase
LEKRILALNPTTVSGTDVHETLALAPAPRIFLIHGGIPPAGSIMESFGEFLVAMGYPRDDLQNFRRQSLSYSPYQSSREMAGYVAWYYEQTGMRPMVIGHSQGGMQTVRILHELNGEFNRRLAVWNPRTGKSEARDQITDALHGAQRNVVGLQIAYASALAAGGMARLNPSHLGMIGKLRTIPNTVEDFAGYHVTMDLLGGDFIGFGGVNDYKPSGSAAVRNVGLPPGSGHFSVLAVCEAARKPEIRNWINQYRPGVSAEAQRPLLPDGRKLVYAAEVWYSVKRHWVLELQRLIRARNKLVGAKPE